MTCTTVDIKICQFVLVNKDGTLLGKETSQLATMWRVPKVADLRVHLKWLTAICCGGGHNLFTVYRKK